MTQFDPTLGTPLDSELFVECLNRHRTDLHALRSVDKRDLTNLQKAAETHDMWELLFSTLSTEGQLAGALTVARDLIPLDTEERVIEGDLEMEEMEFLVPGSLRVKGSLVNSGALIVLGDLSIEGGYVERPVGATLLAVGGDARATHVSSTQSLVVLGSLHAEKLIAGFGDEGRLCVEGTIEATVLWLHDHETRYADLAVAQFFPRGMTPEDQARVLAPECLGDGAVDPRLIERRILDDQPVLQDNLGSRTPLSYRVAGLLTILAAGGSYEFTEAMGKPVLRIGLEDGSRQMSFVDDEERKMLETMLSRE